MAPMGLKSHYGAKLGKFDSFTKRFLLTLYFAINATLNTDHTEENPPLPQRTSSNSHYATSEVARSGVGNRGSLVVSKQPLWIDRRWNGTDFEKGRFD